MKIRTKVRAGEIPTQHNGTLLRRRRARRG
jgi:hypothetical protein